MKKYVVKTPFFVKFLYPKRLWHFSRKQKAIYLTFDDGPIPEVTPWVLEQLKHHNAKATFFCIGANIEKHPTIFEQIKAEGHRVGNHTFNHLNASKTSFTDYIKNTEKAANHFKTPFLFRPPYGKLDHAKANALLKKGYKIVMWDVLSADFDPKITPEECLNNILKNTQNGSIIVFHDSLKSQEKLRYSLPKVLEFYAGKGVAFKAID